MRPLPGRSTPPVTLQGSMHTATPERATCVRKALAHPGQQLPG
jgi:hypothetical protein